MIQIDHILLFSTIEDRRGHLMELLTIPSSKVTITMLFQNGMYIKVSIDRLKKINDYNNR
ncbi:hypothetical protein P689_12334 [Candidatus Riesia pediculischaeffi PTSU]|uniref:Uncharacterized protein n=1 Tax=Candidatus Riesia pediculischaeffi PTSU TaxID=1401651 RepID=A0A0C1VKD5_9ENTR|nr:hypothetical protein P689_12334 [Candidatus Riesia pediculischaeffi PTSU]